MLGFVDFLPGGGNGTTTAYGFKSGETTSPFKKSSFKSTMEKVMNSMSALDHTDMEKLMNSTISAMKDSKTNVATDTNNVLSALDKVDEIKKKL